MEADNKQAMFDSAPFSLRFEFVFMKGGTGEQTSQAVRRTNGGKQCGFTDGSFEELQHQASPVSRVDRNTKLTQASILNGGDFPSFY